ncbi:MAG: glycosyltransferase family 2 protein, partial [Eubacteriaceae bacterium]|nr:glycosyltransferase family 2 protein [Eubacteriaceae bacterium]
MTIDSSIILVGLIFSVLLFSRFTLLGIGNIKDQSIKLSIIIPARNEEKNLPLLLDDLKNQTSKIHEIICVDDESDDDTAKMASFYNIKLISLKNKPEGWIGKSWACQKGADAADGDLFLFLDADVRLSSFGINKLLHAYEVNRCTISVQPYHKTEKKY